MNGQNKKRTFFYPGWIPDDLGGITSSGILLRPPVNDETSRALIKVGGRIDEIFSGISGVQTIRPIEEQGLECLITNPYPPVYEVRKEIDEDYKLRWPNETIGSIPMRLPIEGFLADHPHNPYLIYCFPEKIVDLHDRNNVVHNGHVFSRPRFGEKSFEEIGWSNYSTDLNQAIISALTLFFRALEQVASGKGAELLFLSVRLGSIGADSRTVISQLVEIRVRRDKEILSLTGTPIEFAGIICE